MLNNIKYTNRHTIEGYNVMLYKLHVKPMLNGSGHVLKSTFETCIYRDSNCLCHTMFPVIESAVDGK